MDDILYFNSMIEAKGGIFSAPLILVIVIFLSLSVFMVIFTYGLIDSIKNTTLSLTNRELIIKSIFYGKKIPIENILISEIKAVNLNENQEYGISYRTNGLSLPNVRLGWMRLKNRQKALAFITDKNNVIMIPTKDFVVLFSMSNTDEFIKSISAVGK